MMFISSVKIAGTASMCDVRIVECGHSALCLGLLQVASIWIHCGR